MAVSKLNICNQALQKLKADTITSFTEQSEEAGLCKTFYDIASESVLSMHPWGFARRQRSLSPMAEVPDGFDNWPYAYIYPKDCLFIRKITEGTTTKTAQKYLVGQYLDGGVPESIILTEASDATLQYTARYLEPELAPPLYRSALAFYLAYLIAWPLTNNRTTETQMYQGYLRELTFAQTRDSQETEEEQPVDSWVADVVESESRNLDYLER